jgi:hypothetical protein
MRRVAKRSDNTRNLIAYAYKIIGEALSDDGCFGSLNRRSILCYKDRLFRLDEYGAVRLDGGGPRSVLLQIAKNVCFTCFFPYTDRSVTCIVKYLFPASLNPDACSEEGFLNPSVIAFCSSVEICFGIRLSLITLSLTASSNARYILLNWPIHRQRAR